MRYFDSTCTWDDLVAGNAFSIERHALRVVQPLEDLGNGNYQLACARNGRYRMFGKLDYPHGFAKWWYLSNMEIHVPSEHTQNGKVYDAEIHLNHFYSIAPHGIDNEVSHQCFDQLSLYPAKFFEESLSDQKMLHVLPDGNGSHFFDS